MPKRVPHPYFLARMQAYTIILSIIITYLQRIRLAVKTLAATTNAACGNSALRSNTTGYSNTAIGNNPSNRRKSSNPDMRKNEI